MLESFGLTIIIVALAILIFGVINVYGSKGNEVNDIYVEKTVKERIKSIDNNLRFITNVIIFNLILGGLGLLIFIITTIK